MEKKILQRKVRFAFCLYSDRFEPESRHKEVILRQNVISLFEQKRRPSFVK